PTPRDAFSSAAKYSGTHGTFSGTANACPRCCFDWFAPNNMRLGMLSLIEGGMDMFDWACWDAYNTRIPAARISAGILVNRTDNLSQAAAVSSASRRIG